MYVVADHWSHLQLVPEHLNVRCLVECAHLAQRDLALLRVRQPQHDGLHAPLERVNLLPGQKDVQGE